ncbi:MAG: type II toxin-antitoxin system RelE/ParE family toxin [Erysipelotrichaceae bacterium]|nr:type II toxin-antitoxin system RelE/ParE family toxin [Erysipelotrichaceae bacterium]MBQ6493733.1 type II toxin-antitoxin system RelE/ParE family toxin [Erysipelotrichaceae bacterium]
MFIAEYYQKDDGTYPVEEFILSLDNKMKAKVLWTISLLEDYGTKLRLPYSEHLEDDIFELRIKQSSDITRVLYFFYKDKRIILTNGFVKKSQKTPSGELKLAKDRRENFLKRGGK